MARLTMYVTVVILELLQASDKLTGLTAIHHRPDITN